jgi:hypothetical protein
VDPVEGRGSRVYETIGEKDVGHSGAHTRLTKLQLIAKLAGHSSKAALKNLSHHIDLEWLREAYRRTRKDGAPGADGKTAEAYAQDLKHNLQDLLERFKSGRYRAPPVKRVHIPKGDGSKTRPIGIPTFEDKVLQRAVVMVLDEVYEQDFLTCSYGFNVIKRKTSSGRFRRALARIWDWCKQHRHRPVPEQHRQLCRKLLGHYAYYGITSNGLML